MRTHSENHNGRSPLDILSEMAVEGTSSLVEAQRALLNLIQQENDIVLDGVKERIPNFVPGVAMTSLVRRGIDTLITLQQELLTTASKQTLEWVESTRAGKNEHAEHLAELAREAVEAFTRAQKEFLNAIAEEGAKAAGGKHAHQVKPVRATELSQLARDAGDALIEAQKRLLDVIGQQMNTNLDLATRSLQMISAKPLLPIANITSEEVKNFFKMEKSLIASVVKPRKAKTAAHGKRGRAKVPKTVVV